MTLAVKVMLVPVVADVAEGVTVVCVEVVLLELDEELLAEENFPQPVMSGAKKTRAESEIAKALNVDRVRMRFSSSCNGSGGTDAAQGAPIVVLAA